VRYVGSATAGIDHLDTAYLTEAGIQWHCAKGANARAVVNYVQACLSALQIAHKLPENPRMGIIGVGEVGSRLALYLQKHSSQLLLNDPLRAAHENHFTSNALEEFSDLDLISLHTPLTKTGEFPSHRLINDTFLKRLKASCVLINTARGGVIDESALLRLKQLPTLCFDVWENEPHINLDLMQRCFIATPHIAGYSFAAKTRATHMLYQSFQKIFAWPELTHLKNPGNSTLLTHTEILQHYDPRHDTNSMREALLNHAKENSFENLRRDYALRQEF
jgi:erythronate-4-phosphate dehydrogenase